jgi:hypothetical protein
MEGNVDTVTVVTYGRPLIGGRTVPYNRIQPYRIRIRTVTNRNPTATNVES